MSMVLTFFLLFNLNSSIIYIIINIIHFFSKLLTIKLPSIAKYNKDNRKKLTWKVNEKEKIFMNELKVFQNS